MVFVKTRRPILRRVHCRPTPSLMLALASTLLDRAPPINLAWAFATGKWRQARFSTMPATLGRTLTMTVLGAKRKKNQQSRQDMDGFNNWYDAVDDDATPDDVFWEEMERQKLMSQVQGAAPPTSGGGVPYDLVAAMGGIERGGSGTAGGAGAGTDVYGTAQAPSARNPSITIEEERSSEATLASYAANMVSDNWLDEDYLGLDDQLGEWNGEDETLDEENARLEAQLDELEDEREEETDGSAFDSSMSNEPWDHWGDVADEEEDGLRLVVDPEKAKEFLLPYDEDPDVVAAETAVEEAEYLERLSWIAIRSERLENARQNPKAAAYFGRAPNELEGYDRMWVSAVESPCMNNLVGVFRNYGVEFADNFDDWEDGSEDDGIRTIEDVASYKARKVFEVTGLPCIASRTSFEVEPARPAEGSSLPPPQKGRQSQTNPRVISGYRFNNIGEHVDYIVEALLPVSEPTRVTRFRSCLCFYDGEMEVFEYGECDCDLIYANSMRTFISMSHAINGMCKTMQLSFGLEFQKWMKKKVAEALGGYGGASIKLRDRVLKEGVVLPNDIIDVSAFMDSKVDVALMDECGTELAQRFIEMKPNKILTVATTGLVIAIPMAKHLQVPVVYARKERNIVMADTYQAAYSSKTVGKNRELIVSKAHLDDEDRVLIVDDFLSSGASQEALLRIVSDSGAEAIGVAVLLEKVYDSGRQSLSGYNVPVESMVRVASVRDGVIQLLEEEGYDQM